eukprot:4993379-Pyramimonas_sp.AAC.1
MRFGDEGIPLPIAIEGGRDCKFRYTDERAQFGHARHHITCPHQAGCLRKRNSEVAQKARYGLYEPIACLVAWVRRGAASGTPKGENMGKREVPLDAQKDWLRENGHLGEGT